MAKNMPEIEEYKYGFHDKDVSIFRTEKGLTPNIVKEISKMKEEPQWMLDYRLKALDHSTSVQCRNGAGTFQV